MSPTERERKLLNQEIDALIHELTDGKESFDFEIYFSEVFHKSKGFDVVIMNPPYGASLSEGEKNLLKRGLNISRRGFAIRFCISRPWHMIPPGQTVSPA